MPWLSIILGSLILWAVLSPTAAVLIGKSIRLADAHEAPDADRPVTS